MQVKVLKCHISFITLTMKLKVDSVFMGNTL